MKVTFPHMGNTYIAVKVLLDTLGIEYIIPPQGNRKNLEVGMMHSPEFICMPFKVLLGDFIYGLNKGAEIILFGGGCGQCRLGYYGELHQEILRDLGYEFQYIHLNLSEMSFRDFIVKLKPITKGKSKLKIVLGVLYALKTVFTVDKLFKLVNKTRSIEANRGDTDKVVNKFVKTILKQFGYRSINKTIKNTKVELKNIKIDKNANPIQIAIVGEIYIACEPFANLEIEKKLGNMGVYVYNHLSIAEWIRERFIHHLLPIKRDYKAVEAAQEFIHTDDIGGHGIETVGNSVLSAKRGFDGIIQVYPFTCMPEIIAQSAFSAIQEKYNIPIMTLILDEMTGEAGYMTRLEAFVDMIKMRKSLNIKENPVSENREEKKIV